MVKKPKIEIKILNQQPLYFQFLILKTGKLVFCRDKKRRTEYEAHLLSQYQDFKPFLDYYNKQMYKHIKEGL